MAFKDGLQDIATFYTISLGFKQGDQIGEQVKTESVLYNSIPCRLNSNTRHPGNILRNEEGKQEKFKYDAVVIVLPQYNAANRGDKVVVNSTTYLIVKKFETKGTTPQIHHVIYYLEEAT